MLYLFFFSLVVIGTIDINPDPNCWAMNPYKVYGSSLGQDDFMTVCSSMGYPGWLPLATSMAIGYSPDHGHPCGLWWYHGS